MKLIQETSAAVHFSVCTLTRLPCMCLDLVIGQVHRQQNGMHSEWCTRWHTVGCIALPLLNQRVLCDFCNNLHGCAMYV